MVSGRNYAGHWISSGDRSEHDRVAAKYRQDAALKSYTAASRLVKKYVAD